VETAGDSPSGAHVTVLTHSNSARALSVVVACAAITACSSPSSSLPAASESPGPRSSGADDSQPSAASAVRPDDLRGTWVEYWAVDGGADTERYSFSELGRFEWSSASPQAGQPAPQSAVRKVGAFRIERSGSTPVLVLEIQHETFGACGTGCAGSNQEREVDHATPLVERFELGECPSNPEAQRIDNSYTCRAFGGKAFWRKALDARTATTGPNAG
jgi:hypothetical protein